MMRLRRLERGFAPFEMGRSMNMQSPLPKSTAALHLRQLRKRFDAPAVDGLDLLVDPGEFYALLGPNGAGKTTTLRMVAGLVRPDSGSVHVFGVDALADPNGAKRIVAWLPDEPMLYDKLSPIEYLEFIAGLWGIEPATAQREAQALLETLGLWDFRNARCEGFSRGMKQKVALAGALIHDPKLLILDEPLTGLDAAVARQVKDLLLARARQGAAIILTTHILEVAERLADRIGIIHAGRLLAEGTLAELRRQAGAGTGSLEDVFLQLIADAPALP
jgi:ABC-2 type transport system ATP-binding protein